jgi:hypothetical protein
MNVLLLAIQAATAADCPSPVPAAIFGSQLEDVEAALDAKNLQQMSQMLDILDQQVPCLIQPLSPEQAGRYHLVHGVNRWISKDLTTAKLHFSAAKASAPVLSISTDVFPSAHQIHGTFTGAPGLEDIETVPAADGQLYFDGKSTTDRPAYRPTLFQYGQGGKVSLTVLVQPAAELPGYPLASEAAAAPVPPPAREEAPAPGDEEGGRVVKEPAGADPAPPPKEKPEAGAPGEDLAGTASLPAADRGSGKRTLLAVSTVASASVAGGFLFLNWSSQQAYTVEKGKIDGDPSYESESLETLKEQNDISGTGAIASGVAALGFGVALALAW